MKTFVLLSLAILSPLIITAQIESTTEIDKSWNDFYNNSFTPFTKGNWHTNLVLNFSKTEENNQMKLLANVINSESFDYGISVAGGYFIKNFMSAGLSLKISRSRLEIDYLQDNDTVNNKRLDHSFVVSPFLRNYIPLSSNNRFSVFNETGISIGYGEKLSRKTYSEDKIEKYYGESIIFKFGIKPGINAFIVENFSFEVSVDLIGFEMEYITSKYDELTEGNSSNISFDFKIDLLSLNFGVAYYF